MEETVFRAGVRDTGMTSLPVGVAGTPLTEVSVGRRREQSPVAVETPGPSEQRPPVEEFGSNAERLSSLQLVPAERESSFVQPLATNRWWEDDDGLDPELGTARTRVLAERAAGRGDSAVAVAALAVLANDPAWPALATAECRIALGREQTPLQVPSWIRAIRALPADARGGYERLVSGSRLGKPLAAVLEEMAVQVAATSDADADQLLALRAFRTAGQPSHPSAVAALRVLFSHGWDEARIEAAVTGRDAALVDLGALEPAVRQAYVDARAETPTRTPSRTTSAATTSETPTPTTETPASTPTADRSGGGLGGGGAELGRWTLPATLLAGVPNERKNATAAAALLVLAGVDPALAEWIATADPATVLPLSAGTEKPTPQTTGGYQGYAIRSSDGALWTPADFDRRTAAGGIELGLSRGFFDRAVRPLMEDPGMLAMARADLQARALDAEIAAEMEKNGLSPEDANSPRSRLAWMSPAALEIRNLLQQREQYRTLATDLRTGRTSYTALLGQQLDAEQELDRALSEADARIAEAGRALEERRRVLAEEKAARDSDPNRENRKFATMGGTDDEAVREVEELRGWREGLQSQRDGLARVLATPYAVVPTETLDRLTSQAKQGYTFTSRTEAMGLAMRASLSETGAMFGRVAGGLAQVGAPTVSLALGFDDRGVGAELARRAFARVEALERSAGADTAAAEKVLGTFGTEVVKLLTITALTALPTLGVGAGGAAIGGAIRAGTWGARIGAATSLGGLGALQNSGRGAGAMSWGALSMGMMPLAGSLGSTGATRLMAAFLGNALIDGAGSVDVVKGVDAFTGGRSLDESVRISVANVSIQRMVMNGVVGMMTEAVAIQVEGGGGKPPLLVDPSGPTPRYYRVEGTACIEVPSPSAELVKGAVEVSRSELAAVKAGSTDVAQSALGRRDTVQGLKELLGATDARIAELRKTGSPGAGAELAALSARRSTTEAQLEVLSGARAGEALTDAQVRDAGEAPEGYVRDAETGAWTWRREVAEQAVRARNAQLALARDYRDAVAETDAAWKTLTKLRARKGTEQAQGEQRQILGKLAETSRQKLELLEASIGRSRDALPLPDGPLVLDGATKLGAGAEGAVYALNEQVAVKVPKDGLAVETLQNAVVPTRYGGLGTGEIVTVKLDGLEVRGLAMRRVTGEKLASATQAKLSQVDAFETALANLKRDGVLLSDLHSGNILLGTDGSLAIIDSAVVDRASFGAAMRKVLGEGTTTADIDTAWTRRLAKFEADGEVYRRQLQELALERTAELAPGVDRMPSSERLKAELGEIADLASRGERWAENGSLGTCMSAAMKNAVSAERMGLEAYIVHFGGKRLDTGERAAHAVTVVLSSDGRAHVLSWGKVYPDWQTAGKEVFSDLEYIDTFRIPGHVEKVVNSGWEYRLPDER